MTNYRIDKTGLMERLSIWNGFLKRKVHLIACGGTALTIQGLKESTKDIDLLVPAAEEYHYLIRILEQIGYKPASGVGWSRADGFVFDLFAGKKVHTTELLESPLKPENHRIIKEFSRIYFGVLNDYDLIISKLFRGSRVDFEDCLVLVKARPGVFDFQRLKHRYIETAEYDIAEERLKKHLERFLEIVTEEGINDGK